MARRPVDLFDDPPWPTAIPVDQRRNPFPRAFAVASLVLSVLYLGSMALPWFDSAETPPWTPLSHDLDLRGVGWLPGTERWGYLLLGFGAAAVLAAVVAVRWPRRPWGLMLLVVATALLGATLLEAFARLSVDPGPDLGAYYGAWTGTGLAALAWMSAGLATMLAGGSAPRPAATAWRP